VGSVGIDDERSESFVALCNLPKKHQHFWGKFHGLLTAWKVGSICHDRLIQDSGHSINNELEILWSVESTQKVSIKVLLGL
jgi:hypothetical protein